MVFTLFPSENEEYIINFYRWFRFGKDRNLITTDHGAWALLTD